MTNNQLFSSFQLGSLQLPNRFVMAPLTRGRTGPDHVPGSLAVEYYVQRSMATFYTPGLKGYTDYPALEELAARA